MATGVHIEPALLRAMEDTLGLRVCVWQLTALMSHKRQIMTHVTAPRAPHTLFRLAKNLEFPFSLDKLQTIPAIRDRWVEIYSVMPVSNAIIHVVWKYIFSQKGLTSIQKELRDECLLYGFKALEKSFPEECKNLDYDMKERIIKHLMKDELQEIQIGLIKERNSKTIDYELEIAEKNSEINLLKKRLTTAKYAIVEQNDAFQAIIQQLSKIHIDETPKRKSRKAGGREIWEAALDEINEHIKIVHELQQKYRGETDKTKQLKDIVDHLEDRKTKCEAEIEHYSMKASRLEDTLDDYRTELRSIMAEHKKQSQATNELLSENQRRSEETNELLRELREYKDRERGRSKERLAALGDDGRGLRPKFPLL